MATWDDLLSTQRGEIPVKSAHQKLISFESDYKRVINSSAFRRLQDKTQVFPLNRNDFVRTRMTHSIEVAWISRTMFKQLAIKLKDNSKITNVQYNAIIDSSALIETSALIHDIGNPPFGHFGEQAIRIWFKKNQELIKPLFPTLLEDQMFGDFENFEGNAQTIRLLTKLHDHNGASAIGMNLTNAVLDSVIKYLGNSLDLSDAKQYKKLGYFYSEKSAFDIIKTSLNTSGMRNPLVYLIEAADDLAYTFSDIEDGMKVGLINPDDLHKKLYEILPKASQDHFQESTPEKFQNFLTTYQMYMLNKIV